MDKEKMEKFVKVFNDNFTKELGSGVKCNARVVVHDGKPSLWINIGARDAQIDENMECIGSGTCLC